MQGDIQTASIGTFMAINGDGFFVGAEGGQLHRRPPGVRRRRPASPGAATSSVDKNGYLVNGAGYYLMGIPVDATTGNLVGSVPQLLQFQNDFLPAQPTSTIDYRANLRRLPADPRARHRRRRLRTAQSGDLPGQSGGRPGVRRETPSALVRRAAAGRPAQADRHHASRPTALGHVRHLHGER